MEQNRQQVGTLRHLASFSLLTALTLLVYFNSLKGTFQFDDSFIQNQIYLKNLNFFMEDVEFINKDFSKTIKTITNRPTLLFTFALNNHLNNNRVLGFHLGNLLLQALVVLLVYLNIHQLVFFLKAVPGRFIFIERKYFPQWNRLPLVSAILFGVHPLGTDSVTYISSRSVLLVSFFYLMSIYAFFQFFRAPAGKSGFPTRVLMSLLILAGYFFALSSKLTGITMPAVLIAIFILIISPLTKDKWIKIFFNIRSLAIVVLAIAVPIKIFMVYIPMDSGEKLFSRYEYLLLQFKVTIFYYLKMFLWPINQNVDIGFPLTRIEDDYLILLSIGIALFLFTLCLIKGGRVLVFAVFWYIITLSPTSSIIPLNDLAVEHRLYLPMTMGLCPVMAMTLLVIHPIRRQFLSFVLVVVSFSILISDRNMAWRNELTLWIDSSNKNPRSGRPLNNLGKAYYEEGKLDLAINYFRKSIALMNKIPESHYNLGNILMDKMEFDLAESAYKQAIEIDPLYPEAYLGLGSIYNQTGKYEKAIKQYKAAIRAGYTVRHRWDYSLARLNLSEVYGKLGRYKEAIRQLELAIKQDQFMYKAHYNLGTAYMKIGNHKKSEQAFLKTLEIKPDFKQAIFNLARLYQLQGKWEFSRTRYLEFVKIDDSNPKAYFGIGFNSAQIGNLDDAAQYFKKSLALNPEQIDAHVNLGNIMAKQGNTEGALDHFQKALDLKPDFYQLHVQLGLLEKNQRHNPDLARVHFQKALDLTNDPFEKQKIITLFKSTIER